MAVINPSIHSQPFLKLTLFLLFSLIKLTQSKEIKNLNSTYNETAESYQNQIKNDSSSENTLNFYENSNVIELNKENFYEEIKKTNCALVQFSAPWCQFCKTLKPKYEAAAEILKDEKNPEIKIFNINADTNKQIAEEFGIFSYPTLKYYKINKDKEADFNLTEYEASKNSGVEIAIQMKKLCNDRIIEYESLEKVFEELNKYLNYVILFGYKAEIEKGIGAEAHANANAFDFYNVLSELSEYHKDLIFAFCPLENFKCNPNSILLEGSNKSAVIDENKIFKALAESLAAAFTNKSTGIDSNQGENDLTKLIILRNQTLEKHENSDLHFNLFSDFSEFDLINSNNKTSSESNHLRNLTGSNLKENLNYFINSNAYDHVNKLEDRTAELIFTTGVSSLFFFRNSSSVYTKHDKIIKKAAERLKGKLFFLVVDIESELESRFADLLFIEPEDLPELRIIYTLNDEEIRTYKLDFNFTHPTQEFSEKIIFEFYENFTRNALKPYYKSEPVPSEDLNSESGNKTFVKKVVGSTYNDLVYDVSRHRVIKIYLPWDYFCKKLKPDYEQLAEKFKDYADLVFTELDFSKNEVPNNFIKAYPMIYFFPKGEMKPVVYIGDRSLESLEDYVLVNMGLPAINRNNTDPNHQEQEAPTKPVEEFFRVNRDEIPDEGFFEQNGSVGEMSIEDLNIDAINNLNHVEDGNHDSSNNQNVIEDL